MVIGGVEGFTNFTFDLLFQQYDPKTQRLIPGGGRFVVHDSLYHRDLVASEVPAGYYILTRIVDERRTYNKTFITTPLPREEFNKFFNSVNDDADVSSVRTYRLRLKAGQIAYIGEYVRVTDKTGRWENRPDDLKKILNMMKNIKGETIFQPPRLTSKLDQ